MSFEMKRFQFHLTAEQNYNDREEHRNLFDLPTM